MVVPWRGSKRAALAGAGLAMRRVSLASERSPLRDCPHGRHNRSRGQQAEFGSSGRSGVRRPALGDDVLRDHRPVGRPGQRRSFLRVLRRGDGVGSAVHVLGSAPAARLGGASSGLERSAGGGERGRLCSLPASSASRRGRYSSRYWWQRQQDSPPCGGRGRDGRSAAHWHTPPTGRWMPW